MGDTGACHVPHRWLTVSAPTWSSRQTGIIVFRRHDAVRGIHCRFTDLKNRERPGTMAIIRTAPAVRPGRMSNVARQFKQRRFRSSLMETSTPCAIARGAVPDETAITARVRSLAGGGVARTPR